MMRFTAGEKFAASWLEVIQSQLIQTEKRSTPLVVRERGIELDCIGFEV